ncbi:MAG: DUF1127 domain-containing protein [Sulfitobacter sp.]|nr:DUF1127 domain-containing protein [Sulfitobacter sp.]
MSYTTHSAASRHSAASAHRGSILDRITSLFALWRSRAVLGSLDAHRLEDIGISAEKAAREARKAPWDVPAHWTM